MHAYLFDISHTRIVLSSELPEQTNRGSPVNSAQHLLIQTYVRTVKGTVPLSLSLLSYSKMPN